MGGDLGKEVVIKGEEKEFERKKDISFILLGIKEKVENVMERYKKMKEE